MSAAERALRYAPFAMLALAVVLVAAASIAEGRLIGMALPLGLATRRS